MTKGRADGRIQRLERELERRRPARPAERCVALMRDGCSPPHSERDAAEIARVMRLAERGGPQAGPTVLIVLPDNGRDGYFEEEADAAGS